MFLITIRSFRRAGSLTRKVTDRFEMMYQPDQWVANGGGLLLPALALPVDKKDEFSCPQAHVAALAELIPTVTKIVTIGWRATEDKFLNMLRSSLTGLRNRPELLIVSGSLEGADQTFRNLGAKITQGGHYSVEGGFTGLISDDLETLAGFLRSEEVQTPVAAR
jgi:hypothetical protein